MDLSHFNEMLLDSTGAGLAIVEPGSLRIIFANSRFRQWFQVEADEHHSLLDLVPGFKSEMMAQRLENGRSYTVETEVKVKRRTIAVAVEVNRHRSDDLNLLTVECQNISKIKELEYMIESYSKMVEKQNRTLAREKERVEKLLLNIMPKKIYEELKTFGVTSPTRYDEASVLMLDFVGFTEMSIAKEPASIVSELNDIFTAFDRIVEQFGCERIKTMGDAYMAVSGIPEPTPDHAQNVARVALLLRRYLKRRNEAHHHQWVCRIGIATGPVIGSVVGVQKYVYDIFGPGVNLAARLEAVCGPMEITLSEEMEPRLRDSFQLIHAGQADIRGFGTREIFNLTGANDLMMNELGIGSFQMPGLN